MNSEETVIKKESSKRELFKEKVGYSKTMKSLMTKHGVNTLEDYRIIRKKRKKTERKVQANKHLTAKVNRLSSSKKK